MTTKSIATLLAHAGPVTLDYDPRADNLRLALIHRAKVADGLAHAIAGLAAVYPRYLSAELDVIQATLGCPTGRKDIKPTPPGLRVAREMARATGSYDAPGASSARNWSLDPTQLLPIELELALEAAALLEGVPHG